MVPLNTNVIGFLLLQDELNGRCGWVAGFYFVRNCLNAIASLPENHPPIVVFPDTFTEQLNTNVTHDKWLTIVNIPEEYLKDATQHHKVEEIINGYQCQVLFPLLTIPQFVLNSTMIGWIADFQERHLPHLFSNDELYFRDSINNFITTYCARVLCISQSVGLDFKNSYPTQAEKGVVVPFRSCIDKKYLALDHTVTLEKYNIRHKKYIYLPNQFWIHKNHKMVFEAWQHLLKMGCDYTLVCTGHMHDFRAPEYYNELIAYLQENKLTDHINLLGFITREEQIQLYRGASAILQPSLFEGWNTSLEDAKALGKTVIVANIPVNHEQCDKNAHFFDPHDPYSLAQMINQLWNRLPAGNDARTEQEAYISYQHHIKQFGHALLSVFSSCMQSDVGMLKFPVYLYRKLLAAQKVCDERLALINLLHDKAQEMAQVMAQDKAHDKTSSSLYLRIKNRICRLFQRFSFSKRSTTENSSQ